LLAGVRALVSNIAQRIGFNEILCGQISLAIDEALCNIIKHGYDKRPDGRICLSLWAIENEPPCLRLVIEDEARQVDPSSIQSRDLDDVRPGGLGVYLIHEIMDEVVYEQRPDVGMRLTMVKLLTPAQDGSSAHPRPAPVQGYPTQ
jgi:anti-sigma regulatory factor (Ser/Thr protein kinase)